MSRINNAMKPEYVLKRVNDLINSAVGTNADKEKRMALDQLHAVICVKRKNVWTKAYEGLMKRHIELCVDLKDHITAKDGLHQYRNLCILPDPASLETIITYLLDLSEARAGLARQKADKVSVAAANRVADLEQEESPESIMLSSMTEEGVKERTDREVVIPWLRFLWENYRAVLELLSRLLPKLEKSYHKACERAFKFCLDYSRNMEFRRLCDMLRQQFNNFQRQQPQLTRGGVKPAAELTSESIELHLQTRFAQLEAATTFELWNEAFRTIEDINGIIALYKRTPKPKLMITYYEKLTRIFGVADNKLFHAYSWLKFYQWSLEGRKDMKPEEKAVMASSVVLAALAVPNINDVYSTLAMNEDEEVQTVDKSAQLATLLDFQANPSRQLLLNQIVNLGLLDEVLPEFKGLYEAFESKFFPLKLISTISTGLQAVRANAAVKQYANQLEKVAMIRVLQQLSKVYNTIKLDFLYKLFQPLQTFSVVLVERVLLEAVANKQLNLRISHAQGTVTFKTATSSANVLDTQVSKLGSALNKVARAIESATTPNIASTQSANRRVYITAIAENDDNDFKSYEERKVLIESRKEELERLQLEKALEVERKRVEAEQEKVRLEKERLEEIARLAEQERIRKIQEKKEIIRIQAELLKYNVKKEESELAELDWDARVQLVVDAQNEALKIREEENRKLQDQVKKLDYSVRAIRLETANVIKEKQVIAEKEDAELLETLTKTMQSTWAETHSKNLAEKQRLEKTQALRRTFEASLLQRQREDYDKQMNQFRRRLLQEKRDQRVNQARRLAYEERQRIEEEMIREQERLEAEQLEIERAEKLRKQRLEEEAREREREAEEERRRQAEERKAAELKRAEEEAAAKSAAAAAAAASKPKVDPFGGAKPKSDPFGGAKPANIPDEPPRREAYRPPAAPAARPDPFGGAGGGSKYVPPSARGAGDNAPRRDGGAYGDRRGGGGYGDRDRREGERRDDRGGGDSWRRGGNN